MIGYIIGGILGLLVVASGLTGKLASKISELL